MDPIVFDRVSKRYFLRARQDRLDEILINALKRMVKPRRATDEFWALRDVSFRVPKGEALGIIGHNGAGKSTLLKLASKIAYPTSGKIRMRGRVSALIELAAGFHPDLTGRENVYLNGAILGMSKRAIDKHFDGIVDFSELEQFIDTPVKRYSSGMQMRLGFAVVAHLDPELMLIDEILSVGDVAFQRKCYRRMMELRRQGATILFVSHNLQAMEGLCDRVMLLMRGQTQVEGRAADVIQQYRNLMLEHERRQMQSEGARANGAPASQMGRRHGAWVEGVAVADSSGAPRDAFQSGDAAQVIVTLQQERPLEQPTIHVVIERSDGVLCHEITSPVELLGGAQGALQAAAPNGPQHGLQHDSQRDGRFAVTLEYEQLSLGPGSYRINVDVTEQNGRMPLDHVEQAAVFTIRDEGSQRGIVQMPCRWLQPQIAHSQRAS